VLLLQTGRRHVVVVGGAQAGHAGRGPRQLQLEVAAVVPAPAAAAAAGLLLAGAVVVVLAAASSSGGRHEADDDADEQRRQHAGDTERRADEHHPVDTGGAVALAVVAMNHVTSPHRVLGGEVLRVERRRAAVHCRQRPVATRNVYRQTDRQTDNHTDYLHSSLKTHPLTNPYHHRLSLSLFCPPH